MAMHATLGQRGLAAQRARQAAARSGVMRTAPGAASVRRAAGRAQIRPAANAPGRWPAEGFAQDPAPNRWGP